MADGPCELASGDGQCDGAREEGLSPRVRVHGRIRAGGWGRMVSLRPDG